MRLAAIGIVVVGIAGTSLWGGSGRTRQAQQADFHWRGALAAGKTLTIRGVNGSIRALPGSGGEAEVTAVKHGRRSDPDEVEIQVVPSEDGVTICAVYPAPRHRGANECLAGGRGENNTENNDVEVEFTAHVPAGVNLVANTVSGDVTADSLGANVRAHTVNGDVEVSTRGYAEGSSVNGSIRAAMGRADWTGGLEFNTVNGGITVAFPAGLGASIEAKTVNGDLESDFPLTVQGRFSRRTFRGTVGNGGRDLTLSTVNGSIKLVKAP